MQITTVGSMSITVGWVLALLVLLLSVVFMAINQLELRPGLLIAGVALARLL